LRKIRKPDNRNETIDFKSIIIGFGLGIVPPIIPSLVGLLFFEKVYLKKNILFFIILVFFGILFTMFSKSVWGIYNLIAIGIIVLYKPLIKFNKSNLSITPIIIWFIISILLGLTEPQLPGEPRLRFYGGEINFTGFYLIILALILIERGKNRIGNVVLILSFVLTLSRSAFFVAIFIWTYNNILATMRLKKMLGIGIIGTFILVLTLKTTSIFNSQSGYAMGPERLFVIKDASSMSRIYLNKAYGDLIVSDINYMLFGVPVYHLKTFMLNNEIENVVHNSFLFKIIKVGIPITIFVIASGFYILPKSVMFAILIYSMSLHALLSPPLFLLLSLYMKKK